MIVVVAAKFEKNPQILGIHILSHVNNRLLRLLIKINICVYTGKGYELNMPDRPRGNCLLFAT